MADEAPAAEDTTDTAAATETTAETTAAAKSAEEASTMLADAKPDAADPTGDKGDTADDGADKGSDTKGDEKDGDGEAELPNYDDLTVAEGLEVDEVALGNFKELAATMNDGKGLSKEDAQKLVDFRGEMVKAQVDQWEQTFSEWRGEIQADKDLGGKNFASKTVPNVLAAAEKYGGKEMVQLLKTNKMYGENPHLIRLLNRVGETLREDKVDRSPKAAEGNQAEAKLQRMYPSHYENKE